MDTKSICDKLDNVIELLESKINFDSLTQIESKEAKPGNVLVLVYKPNGTWDDDLVATNVAELLDTLSTDNNRLFRHSDELADYKLIEIPKSDLPRSWRDKIDYNKYPSFMRIDSLISAVSKYQGRNFSAEDEWYVKLYSSKNGMGDPKTIRYVGPLTEDKAHELVDDFKSKYKSRRDHGWTQHYEATNKPVRRFGDIVSLINESEARRYLQDDFDNYKRWKGNK